MQKEYKINSRNSTVCGYPGRDFDWTKFDWEGKSIYKSIFRGHKNIKANIPYIDNCSMFIESNCQYLHVPYDFTENGTVYRVRPNLSMRAGEVYRGHLILSQKAVKKKDGWYWVLDMAG